MPKIKLPVIPKPAEGTRAILVPEKGVIPVIKGTGGDIDLLCGNCGIVLASGLVPTQKIVNIVIKCPNCGSYNDTPPGIY